MWEHAFIIFNNTSRIEKRFKKPEEYIKQVEDSAKCPKELKEMLKEVGHRYICVESVDRLDDDHYWQCKSKEVVEMILRLKDQNKGMRYKNKIMSMGLKGYKIVKDLKKKKEIENTKETTASPEYSVLVVGYAGVRKSAFCNFLTRTKLFNESECYYVESSNEINKQHCEVLGMKITIIDCPGFGDTEKTIEEYSTELGTYLTQHTSCQPYQRIQQRRERT